MDFCESVRPFAALTFHAKGEEIYFADENTPEVTAYAQGMVYFANAATPPTGMVVGTVMFHEVKTCLKVKPLSSVR